MRKQRKYGSRSKRRGLIPQYCEWCGYTRIVECHRITPGREGGKYTRTNVVGLCPTHHAEADIGIIPRESLLAIVDERIRLEDTLNGQTQTIKQQNGISRLASADPSGSSASA